MVYNLLNDEKFLCVFIFDFIFKFTLTKKRIKWTKKSSTFQNILQLGSSVH